MRAEKLIFRSTSKYQLLITLAHLKLDVSNVAFSDKYFVNIIGWPIFNLVLIR